MKDKKLNNVYDETYPPKDCIKPVGEINYIQCSEISIPKEYQYKIRLKKALETVRELEVSKYKAEYFREMDYFILKYIRYLEVYSSEEGIDERDLEEIEKRAKKGKLKRLGDLKTELGL